MNTYTGTIAFRAPEMFSHVSYNESIDVWAAGCVLFTMLCGEQPFYSKYITDLIKLIEECKFNFNKENWNMVSLSAKDLIKKMLQSNPDERPCPNGVLKHEWLKKTKKNSLLC